MNICIIDIGSNTVKASIYSVIGKTHRREIAYKGNKEKLITYVDENKFMSEEGIRRLNSSLEGLLSFSEEHGCQKVFAFATASLRGVQNSEYIVESIFEKYSLHIDILSAEDEALCSLRGLLTDPEASQVKNGIMIDMGGGSTEIVLFENGKMPQINSLNFGCLSLNELSVSREELSKIIKKELLKCSYVKNSSCPLFLIGGTARAVLKIINVEKNTLSNNLRTDGIDFSYIADNMHNEKFIDFVKKVVPSRANTVFSGALAYSEIIKFIKPTAVIVSDSGVRDGYLERILP